jgi:nickel-type superoxide dismutase maturation protease
MRKANLFDILLARFGLRKRVKTVGDSMLPTLKDGDEVIVKSTAALQVGDIVVAKHPFRQTPVIKRITKFSTCGKLFLSGDNPQESTDSRSFGGIPAKDVLGKVICRLE